MLLKKKLNMSAKKVISLASCSSYIGLELHGQRMSEKMSQIELSKVLGISQQHLCDIEKGRKIVSPERAVYFAEVLNCSKKYFVELALQDLVTKAGLEMKVQVF